MYFTAEVRLVVGRESFGVELAKLLLYINMRGSLKEAAEACGVPYSTAWNLLARAERALGQRLVESAKGVGTALTPQGRELLAKFLAEAGKRGVFLRVGRLIYAGSHDPALEESLPPDVEAYYLGSLRGLLAVASGDAHFAGIHLGDNAAAVKTYAPHLVLIPGFKREVGIAYRKELAIKSAEDLRGLRVVNMPPGAGSRVLLDKLLRELGLAPRETPGYFKTAQTHREAAEAVARGEGDYTIAPRHVAEKAGLGFLKLAEEDFDFAAAPEVAEEAAQLVRKIRLPPGYAPKAGGANS
ncbi:MAG: substrate-binding domain-containing protein [Pyrobaculum sp.]